MNCDCDTSMNCDTPASLQLDFCSNKHTVKPVLSAPHIK